MVFVYKFELRLHWWISDTNRFTTHLLHLKCLKSLNLFWNCLPEIFRLMTKTSDDRTLWNSAKFLPNCSKCRFNAMIECLVYDVNVWMQLIHDWNHLVNALMRPKFNCQILVKFLLCLLFRLWRSPLHWFNCASRSSMWFSGSNLELQNRIMTHIQIKIATIPHRQYYWMRYTIP